MTGLVGSRIVELLEDKYEFENLSLDSGVDITDKLQVAKRITDSPAGVILHLAAKADVDGCEKDKPLGKNGDAWRINVDGTKNIVQAAKETGKKVIYISTDFVFDGTKNYYSEEDTTNPINWYGVTKHEGEKVIKDSGVSFLISRISFPYRAKFAIKKDLFRGILEKLQSGQKLQMVGDEIITPTFIDDIGNALDLLISQEAQGIYHVVGSHSYTPFELARIIAKKFSLDEGLITQTSGESYFAGRAPRPFSLALKNDKLKKLGISMSSFEEGLDKIKSQLANN